MKIIKKVCEGIVGAVFFVLIVAFVGIGYVVAKIYDWAHRDEIVDEED